MTGTPLIIEAARNGQTPKSQNPGVPYADDEIVEQAVAGKMPPGGTFKFYFGTEKMPFGLPPTAKALEAYLEMIGGSGIPLLVSSFGDDCVACGLAEESIKRGGHVQVGLEPLMGLTDRVPTNLELVEEVVELVKKYDRPIATPAQAAMILNLPTYPVPFGQQR